jgi:hypothetical protein
VVYNHLEALAMSPQMENSMNKALPGAVAIGEAVLYQELEGEVVLLNMAKQEYYGLNDVGAQMWKCLLESSGSMDSAEDLLSKTYEIERSVIRADLERLVRELLDAGLLRAA